MRGQQAEVAGKGQDEYSGTSVSHGATDPAPSDPVHNHYTTEENNIMPLRDASQLQCCSGTQRYRQINAAGRFRLTLICWLPRRYTGTLP